MSKRNLLLLMEPTRSAQVAQQIACHLASLGNCTLTGIRIEESDFPADLARESDLSHTLAETLKTADPTSTDDVNELLSRQNIRLEEKTLTGSKYTLLAQEAESNDLTLIGREGNFEEQADDAKEVISLMLQYRARPLIIAPPDSAEGDDVLLTYDGNSKSSRAIQMFVLLGLAKDRRLTLLCVDSKEKVAQAKLENITKFLEQHELSATTEVIESRSSDELTERINSTRPSLVVAGARGTHGWRQTVFGSTGDFLIRHCPVPLFTSP